MLFSKLFFRFYFTFAVVEKSNKLLFSLLLVVIITGFALFELSVLMFLTAEVLGAFLKAP